MGTAGFLSDFLRQKYDICSGRYSEIYNMQWKQHEFLVKRGNSRPDICLSLYLIITICSLTCH